MELRVNPLALAFARKRAMMTANFNVCAHDVREVT
jgi:hypothetical protein